ncbi:MAG: hypothetical protein ABJF23_23845 [Bryobacteraceae bacterium]
MTNLLENPRFFGAACLLFVGATLFNATMNAAPSQQGSGLRNAPSAVSVPVLKIGPTIPPSPWDDDAPSVVVSKL